MSFDPKRRYQTPSQLLDAVRSARRDISGGPGSVPGSRGGPKSVFVAESNERLQEALREGLKGHGYRVLLAADPTRALDRFRQQPYDALIVDVESVGEEGLLVFERVLAEAQTKGLPCAGIVILGEDEADWSDRVATGDRVAVMVRPVGFKELRRKLRDLLGGQ
jgi:DNA-binding response OmpR family regulator